MGEYITRELFDDLPEVEFSVGYHYFLGNINNYIFGLLATLKSVKAKLPILETIYNAREYEGLRTLTQTLYRMMNQIGAKDIAMQSYELETALLNQEDRCQELLEDYIDTLEQFLVHLEQLLMKLDMKSLQKKQEQVSYFNYDFTKTKESIQSSADLLERKII